MVDLEAERTSRYLVRMNHTRIVHSSTRMIFHRIGKNLPGLPSRNSIRRRRPATRLLSSSTPSPSTPTSAIPVPPGLDATSYHAGYAAARHNLSGCNVEAAIPTATRGTSSKTSLAKSATKALVWRIFSTTGTVAREG